MGIGSLDCIQFTKKLTMSSVPNDGLLAKNICHLEKNSTTATVRFSGFGPLEAGFF